MDEVSKMTASPLSATASPEANLVMQHDTKVSSLGDTAKGDCSDDESEPDYDYLAEETSSTCIPASEEPDFYDNLGLDCENDLRVDESPSLVLQGLHYEECKDNMMYEPGDEDYGDEYILGTLMVRVLQARNLKVFTISS